MRPAAIPFYWQNGKMVLRWMALAFLRTEKRFKRIMQTGHGAIAICGHWKRSSTRLRPPAGRRGGNISLTAAANFQLVAGHVRRKEHLMNSDRLTSILTIIAIVILSGTLISAQGTGQTTAGSDSGPTSWNVSNLPRWAYVNGFSAFGRGDGRGKGAPERPGVQPPANEPVEHVPGSAIGLTPSQMHASNGVPDWFPNNHPPMPEVVSHGRPPYVQACAWCHLPNGQGRPENASLAGLSEGYILRQIADFKDGLRKSGAPVMFGSYFMVPISDHISDADAEASAKYFSSFKYKPWIRVVETDTVPVTHPVGHMFSPVEGGGTEPIGNRIIEVPENPKLVELRDDESGFIAYVPKGSVKRGKRLVMTGGHGKTIRCAICHGSDLMGIGDVPFIVGRSPDQMVRQLIDIQAGTRRGPYSLLMRQPVQNLSLKDIVDITAYLASLRP
jgi:cytochrome c553